MQRVLFLSILIFNFSLSAQRSLQSINLNFHTGSSNHVGDLASGNINAILTEARSSFGGEFSFYGGPKWGIGIELDYGKLYADNSNHQLANYSGVLVRSNFVNSGLRITYNILEYGKYWKRNSVSPYIFGMGGVALSQSKYMTDVIYPSDCVFDTGTNISGSFGGGLGVKIRLNEHWTTSAEIYNYWIPGDRLEGFHTSDDQTPDLLLGLRIGLNYSIYTW